jgi:hypothetical protein
MDAIKSMLVSKEEFETITILDECSILVSLDFEETKSVQKMNPCWFDDQKIETVDDYLLEDSDVLGGLEEVSVSFGLAQQCPSNFSLADNSCWCTADGQLIDVEKP